MPGDISPSRPSQRLLWHEITRQEAAVRVAEALIVLPVGATEQHGPHLPLGTDSLIVEHVARAAAQAARERIDLLVAPTLPYGSSHHHLPFGGTVSLSTERYYGALGDMAESLVASGARRVFILNGHGGNHELIQLVARDLTLRQPVNIGAASYWDLASAALAAHAPELGERLPGHAGLFETSLLLALHPDLVADPLPARAPDEAARSAIPPTPFRAERHGFWQSIAGHTDSPHEASAVFGQRLLGLIVPAVADAFVAFARLPLVAGSA
jgi:creatinine amidohydrolase